MVRDIGLNRRFEDFVVKLFAAHGFTPRDQSSAITDDGPRVADLVIGSHSGSVAVVELKFFRARRVSTDALRIAAARVLALREKFASNWAVIATTARLDPLGRAELKDPYLVIYDYDRLAWLAATDPRLAAEFEAIVRDARVFGTGEEDVPLAIDEVYRTPAELNDLQTPSDASPVNKNLRWDIQTPLRGKQLCAELDAIKTTRSKNKNHPQARAFEKKCIECIKYLFARDLQFGHEQKPTKKGLSRYDFIARISSKSEFWNLLVTDFRSRYVVFEFKCYTDKITQGEILTTEKYLYLPALRSTAIIISTNGPNENAYETACGALREHGKLILNLTVNQLCNMLKAKDGINTGDDETADVEGELSVTLDEMLMTIDR